MTEPAIRTTQFGFAWGPVNVERRIHVEGRGVSIRVETIAGKFIDIYVSPAGQSLRVFEPSGEWVRP